MNTHDCMGQQYERDEPSGDGEVNFLIVLVLIGGISCIVASLVMS